MSDGEDKSGKSEVAGFHSRISPNTLYLLSGEFLYNRPV